MQDQSRVFVPPERGIVMEIVIELSLLIGSILQLYFLVKSLKK